MFSLSRQGIPANRCVDRRYTDMGTMRHQLMFSAEHHAEASANQRPVVGSRLNFDRSWLFDDAAPPEDTPTPTFKMKAKHVLRIASCHIALYCFVIVYILAGAYVFHYMEGEHEDRKYAEDRRRIVKLRGDFVRAAAASNSEKDIEDFLRLYIQNISEMHLNLDSYLTFDDPTLHVPKRWTYPSSVLFSFTILTTIGYGNVAPSTRWCQMFTMIYGAVGIPLFLITIADVGRFFKTGIMYTVQRVYRKEFKKQGERKLLREIGEVLLVAFLFVAFILAGSAVLPLWESQLSYFDSIYFSYIEGSVVFRSLTTIGLGDIVPRRMDFLLPTLIYITIGLWLTSALVEQLADVFRLVHYYGRQVSNVKGITVWLGGRRLSIGSLIHTVCRRVGMSEQVAGQINWDRTLDQVLSGIAPPMIPIFPWHFADFIERDPPLIDLSMDFDQMEELPRLSRTINGFNKINTLSIELELELEVKLYLNEQKAPFCLSCSFYCSAQSHPLHQTNPPMQRVKRMSAPDVKKM